MRIRDDFRAELERRAAENGRSLSEEAEHAIEQYFGLERRFHGQHIVQYMEGLAAAVWLTEIKTGKRFNEDPATREEATVAMYALLGAFGFASVDKLQSEIKRGEHGTGVGVAVEFLYHAGKTSEEVKNNWFANIPEEREE